MDGYSSYVGPDDIMYAAIANNISACRRLIEDEGADVHYINMRGESCLWQACHFGHLALAEYLVSEGANIHDTDNRGFSCLMSACHHGHLNIVEYLVSLGAIIDDKTYDGWSSLMLSSYHGHLEIAEYLVSLGASINDKAKDGRSSLMVACYNERLDIAELLMSEGANIHGVSNNGFTCLTYARNVSIKANILYRLRKWPTTMAILILQELALIYIIDSESVIDLHQYLGRPDDCSKSDNEEDYGDLEKLFGR